MDRGLVRAEPVPHHWASPSPAELVEARSTRVLVSSAGSDCCRNQGWEKL